MPPTTAPSPHARGRRAGAAEEAILAATIQILVEVGYERMTMDAVAELAHASKATIYRHFPDKASLVFAAVMRCEEEMFVPVDTGTLRGDLLAFATHACEATSGTDGALFAGLVNASRNDPTLGALLRTRLSERKAAVIQAVAERAAARGEIEDPTRARLASEVATAVVLQRLLVAGEPLDDAFRIHLVDEIVIPLLAWGATGTTPSSDRSPNLHPRGS